MVGALVVATEALVCEYAALMAATDADCGRVAGLVGVELRRGGGGWGACADVPAGSADAYPSIGMADAAECAAVEGLSCDINVCVDSIPVGAAGALSALPPGRS